MPIYSEAELSGGGRRTTARKKARKAKVVFLWADPDAKPTRYDLTDEADAEAYAADQVTHLTLTEVKKARARRADDEADGQLGWKDAVGDAIKEGVGSVSGGRSRRRSRSVASRRPADGRANSKKPRVSGRAATAGNFGKVAGTLAARLTIAAALVAAAWWRAKSVDDQRRKDYTSKQIGKREAILGRELSPNELAMMIDFYADAYDAQKAYTNARSAAPKTLR